jgi:Carboxypeptidase regulatory-like domain
MNNNRFYPSTCLGVLGRIASTLNLANSKIGPCRANAGVVRQMVAAAALLTGVVLPIHAMAADYPRIEAVTDTRPPVHTHDLAIVSLKAPGKVTLSSKKPTVVKTVKVAIQNRSPYIETIQDLSTLARLVNLSVVPEATGGNCAAPVPVLHAGKPQPVLPVSLKPNKTLKLVFDVTYTCAVDPLKGSGHGDFHYIAQVDASALDGQEDVSPASDVCPRDPLPAGTNPFPDVSMRDRGCGGKLPGKTLGAAVLSDIVVKGGSGGNKTYTISGVVINAASETAITGVSIYLSGSASATTTTNLKGEYSFSGLTGGDYSVTPNLARTTFSPSNRSITVTAASVGGADFVGVPASPSLIASGIDFLPDIFKSAIQYRASLVVTGGNAFFTDSSNSPLKKFSLSDLAVTSLAQKIGTPESVFLHDENIFWVDGGRLNVTSLDGTQTTVLASGERDLVSGLTSDVVFDDEYAYWVNTVSSPECSPACTWIIQRVPLAGGAPVTLATVDRKIVALTSDASNIYWEEESTEPLTDGCQCGSSIKVVPKIGGYTVVLVDGQLNEALPTLPPGYTPGSWQPVGGLAVDTTRIVFAVGASSSYQIKTVPISGGAISPLASVPSSAGYAFNAIRNISVDTANVYWIDSANSVLYMLPVTGGDITALASDLGVPDDLRTRVTLVITADSAYWTEPGTYSYCCLQMGSGRIRRVSLSGGSVGTVISGLDSPGALSVDSQNIVWAETWRVAKAPLGGGPATTLASGITTDMARIAVDQSNIYILDGDFVKKVPINGGTVEKLSPAHGGNINDDSAINQGIVTDGSSVYWIFINNGTDPAVQKIPTTGGAAVTLAAAQGIFGGPQECYWRIAVDAQSVYWSTTSSQYPIGCTVKKVPVDGGATTTLADFPYLRDFTVDGENVYFSELGSNPGSILKTSLDGGPITTVVTNVIPWVLVNDTHYLYWYDPRSQGGSGGIEEIAKKGQEGVAEAAHLTGPLATDPMTAAEGIVVEQGSLYWTESLSGDIYSIE